MGNERKIVRHRIRKLKSQNRIETLFWLTSYQNL